MVVERMRKLYSSDAIVFKICIQQSEILCIRWMMYFQQKLLTIDYGEYWKQVYTVEVAQKNANVRQLAFAEEN